MPALVEVESSTGTVLFEGTFSEAALEEIAFQDRVDDVIRAAQTNVQTVAVTIHRCATDLRDALDDLATGQRHGGSFSSAEIELGIAVTGEGNVVVAKGSAEANLKVTLTWNFGSPGD
jgi:hypothetical protein